MSQTTFEDVFTAREEAREKHRAVSVARSALNQAKAQAQDAENRIEKLLAKMERERSANGRSKLGK
jgi:hypothetical protein